MTRRCTLSISIIATRASGSIDGFAFTRYSSITLYCYSGVDFNENFSNYLFRSTPFLPSKLKTRKERSWAELRLKNISIQWLSFTVVVIRFKRHSFFNIFLFRLSIEINEFCSKSCVDITGWTETRLHDSSVWKFIFDHISRVLLRCERVCVCIRVFYFLILSRKQRHAVPLSTLLVTVTNKLKEFIIHALLLARIEHVHISPVERSSLFWMSIIVTDSYVCIWCMCVCVCVYMRVDGWLVGSLLSSTVRRTVHEIVRSRH